MNDLAKIALVPAEAPLSGALRWSIYALLIAICTGMMLARIARVRSPDPKNNTPFLSANDRSRWATIRALGDDGAYSIDHIIFNAKGEKVRGWHTIDLVRHRGPDGREHYYSSKPTLLTTLLAGEYWLLKVATGATLEKQTFFVARIMLVLTNVVPLVIALILLARLIDVGWAVPTSSLRTGLLVGTAHPTDFTRIFAVAAACFATFLTTYSVTLNNHLIAGVSLVFALVLILPMWQSGRFDGIRLAWAGLCLGFLAANELPALSLTVVVAAALIWKSPQKALLAFVPAALVVAVTALQTNQVAHGDWRTAYAHRQDGYLVTSFPLNAAAKLDRGGSLKSLGNDGEGVLYMLASYDFTDRGEIIPRTMGQRWELWDPTTQRRFAVVRAAEKIEVRRWDNWYDYPGSYWLPNNLSGIDRGEPSPLVYAFNVLIGHHGLFSLTPIWLLSAIGSAMWLRRGDSSQRALAVTTIVITLVVVAFYLTRPQIDRNYGGGTCCLRWLIWLTPLWLLTLLPAADWLSRTWSGRGAMLALLAISVFSAHYATDNPWSHPWIFDYWTALGWIKY